MTDRLSKATMSVQAVTQPARKPSSPGATPGRGQEIQKLPGP